MQNVQEDNQSCLAVTPIQKKAICVKDGLDKLSSKELDEVKCALASGKIDCTTSVKSGNTKADHISKDEMKSNAAGSDFETKTVLYLCT